MSCKAACMSICVLTMPAALPIMACTRLRRPATHSLTALLSCTGAVLPAVAKHAMSLAHSCNAVCSTMMCAREKTTLWFCMPTSYLSLGSDVQNVHAMEERTHKD